jgi:hypothetical protein
MSAPAAVQSGTRQTVCYFVLLALIGAAIVLISTILVVRYDTSY